MIWIMKTQVYCVQSRRATALGGLWVAMGG